LTLALAELPVLPETVELRVREDLSDEETTQLEGRYPGEPVIRSNLDGLPGSWVLWHRVDSLIGSDGDARVYVLDPGSGRVRFGDGRSGRIPPAGRDNIRCFTYQQGGGPAGNLPAWSQVRLTSAVEGVETVVLPLDTAGGYGAPAADSLFATAPDRLRHSGRAVSPADVEALAVVSSADVVRARCARPDGPGDPIRVTIAVRGGGTTRCPQPTLAQREDVAAAIRAAGWGGLGQNGISVRGPVYLSVAVTARVVAPPDRVAEVEHAAKDALAALLDPVVGGRDGAGWPFGRRPTEGDLLRVLDRVPGVDRVLGVDITAPGGGRLQAVPPDGMVCAELGDIHVVVADAEATS
jgi:predicted phage baseplate assembly protein